MRLSRTLLVCFVAAWSVVASSISTCALQSRFAAVRDFRSSTPHFLAVAEAVSSLVCVARAAADFASSRSADPFLFASDESRVSRLLSRALHSTLASHIVGIGWEMQPAAGGEIAKRGRVLVAAYVLLRSDVLPALGFLLLSHLASSPSRSVAWIASHTEQPERVRRLCGAGFASLFFLLRVALFWPALAWMARDALPFLVARRAVRAAESRILVLSLHAIGVVSLAQCAALSRAFLSPPAVYFGAQSRLARE